MKSFSHVTCLRPVETEWHGVGPPPRTQAHCPLAWGSPVSPGKRFKGIRGAGACRQDSSPGLLPWHFSGHYGQLFSQLVWEPRGSSGGISGICQSTSAGSPFSCHSKSPMPKPGLDLPCGFVATPPSLFPLGTSKLRQGYGRLQLRQGQAKSGILGVPSLPPLPGQATSTSLLCLSPCPHPRPSPGP